LTPLPVATNQPTNQMTTTFSTEQIETLRNEYAKIERVGIDALDKFRALFSKCDDNTLIALSKAKINFVSKLAINACVRRNLI
jgi:hypothetical protein